MYQGQLLQVTVKLSLAGTAATGVLATDLTLRYWRQGDTALTVSVVDPANWLELGFGLYALTIPASVMTKTGTFYLRLTGVLFDLHEQEFLVEASPISLLAYPGKCIVSGNLIQITGNPSLDQTITFRVANVPSRVGGSIVSADREVTVPDALGNFSVPLIQGALVLVEIPQTGIRQQITIPAASSAQLLDLLPPIP